MMICNIDGTETVGCLIDGKWKKNLSDISGKSALNVCGTARYPLAYSSQFNTFESNLWKCKTGGYRGWHYMPQDFSNNVQVNNSILSVRNLRDNPTQNFEWSGMWADTKTRLEMKYGRVTARIRFPSDAIYYHSTLWMLGAERGGEVDIAESNSGRVTAAIHTYDKEGNTHSFGMGEYKNVDSSDWHIYTFEWDEEKAVFYIDGRRLNSMKVADANFEDINSLLQPFYFVINTNPYDTSREIFNTTDSVTTQYDWLYIYSNNITLNQS